MDAWVVMEDCAMSKVSILIIADCPVNYSYLELYSFLFSYNVSITPYDDILEVTSYRCEWGGVNAWLEEKLFMSKFQTRYFPVVDSMHLASFLPPSHLGSLVALAKASKEESNLKTKECLLNWTMTKNKSIIHIYILVCVWSIYKRATRQSELLVLAA
jgi:hypothetical protein